MLHFELDSSSGVPAYRQITDQVSYYVVSGALEHGARLPSIRELARYLRVNPTTIVKAYGELAHAGVIEQRQGSGAFVCGRPAALSKRDRRRKLRESARRLIVEAGQMGASADEVLEVVEAELGSLDDDADSTTSARQRRR